MNLHFKKWTTCIFSGFHCHSKLSIYISLFLTSPIMSSISSASFFWTGWLWASKWLRKARTVLVVSYPARRKVMLCATISLSLKALLPSLAFEKSICWTKSKVLAFACKKMMICFSMLCFLILISRWRGLTMIETFSTGRKANEQPFINPFTVQVFKTQMSIYVVAVKLTPMSFLIWIISLIFVRIHTTGFIPNRTTIFFRAKTKYWRKGTSTEKERKFLNIHVFRSLNHTKELSYQFSLSCKGKFCNVVYVVVFFFSNIFFTVDEGNLPRKKLHDIYHRYFKLLLLPQNPISFPTPRLPQYTVYNNSDCCTYGLLGGSWFCWGGWTDSLHLSKMGPRCLPEHLYAIQTHIAQWHPTSSTGKD